MRNFASSNKKRQRADTAKECSRSTPDNVTEASTDRSKNKHTKAKAAHPSVGGVGGVQIVLQTFSVPVDVGVKATMENCPNMRSGEKNRPRGLPAH